jgi:PASTA domain
VTDNVAGDGGGFVADSISFFAGTTKTVRNSIVAGSSQNCFNSGPPIASSGGNIEDAATCNFNGPGDLTNTDPQLGALRANGGLGLTQVPLSSSPAFGLARPAFCSATDQRGLARPLGGACDSGAVESATPPVSAAPPSIGGTPAAGQTLTCDPGTFTQAPALVFQWLSDGAAIVGATGSTFVVTSAQLDTAVQCRVTATNAGGTTVATSAAVVPPKPPVQLPTAPAATPAVVVQPLAAPVATVRPALSGTLRTGLQATCSPGSFTAAASTAVTWLRNGTPIAGATGATYTLTASDAGKALQCAVAATGRGGTTRAESAPAVPAQACIVPALVGQTQAAARRRLTRANCALGRTTRRRSAKRPGRVLAASPAKGRNLAAGSRIALTIAKR